jgi:small GTP-binding protein
MDKAITIKKKICLLGSFAVGKTSLIDQFVYNRFEEKYLTTIGVKISQKILPPVQDQDRQQTVQHTFLIWDIAGLEKFDHVAMNYFRGAAGGLAVADLTRRESIEDLHAFCGKFLSVNPDSSLVILGNKSDIFQQDRQTLFDLEQAAAQYASECILTSAKTGNNVEKAFLKLSQKIGRKNE